MSTDVSVLYPLQPLHADLVAPYAKLAIDAGARRLWTGQSMAAESHQVLAYLAGTGLRLPVGIGVTLTPLRHPFEAAVQARSLALLTGYPVVVGYGAATPEFVAGLMGKPYRRPATAVASYADAVRRLIAAGLPGVAPAGPAALSHPRVEVAVGVLRPGMARAAGGAVDVAVTWMTPPEYIRDTLIPALVQGAAHRQRAPRVATTVHVGLAKPGRDPRRLALAAARFHLGAPHYVDMLRRAGIPVDPTDPEKGADSIVEAGVYAYGRPEDVAETIRGYQKAGVDEVIVNAAGVAIALGDDEALRDLRAVFEAIDHSREEVRQ